MLTPIEITNLALSYIHLDQIASMDDDNDRARAARANWENCRRVFLTEHPRSFAKRSAVLAERTVTGITWEHAYSCPADFLAAIRIIHPSHRSMPGSLDYEIVLSPDGDERLICSDCENALLEYISDRASMSLWSPLAIEALAHRLAYLIGAVLMRDSETLRGFLSVYQASLAAAALADASGRTYPRLAANTYNDARIIASVWR